MPLSIHRTINPGVHRHLSLRAATIRDRQTDRQRDRNAFFLFSSSPTSLKKPNYFYLTVKLRNAKEQKRIEPWGTLIFLLIEVFSPLGVLFMYPYRSTEKYYS